MERGSSRSGEDERLQFASAVVEAGATAPDSRPMGPAQAGNEAGLADRLRELAALLRGAAADELDRGTAFLFIPVFLGAGALAYFAMPTEPGDWQLGAFAFLAAGLFWMGRERTVARLVFGALLCAALGLLAAKAETWRASTKIIGSDVSTRVTARVERIEDQANGRPRFTLAVLKTERPELRYAPDRIRVTARQAPENLRIGQVVSGVVRLMPPSGPVRPQAYDFAFESYFAGIGAIGFFLGNPAIVESGDHPPPKMLDNLQSAIEELRLRLAGRIGRSIGGPEGQIAAALITGVRAGIPEEANEDLRVTGLYHVLSISGLHMALLAGTVMVGLRTGFALFPDFAARRPVKKYAAAAALSVCALYLLISGFAVAAQRSFVMIAIMLIAVMADRAAITMRNLAIAAIVILLVAPHEIVGPSFQMSFAATAALIAAYAAWSRHRMRRVAAYRPPPGGLRRVLRTTALYAGGLAATSVVAGLASGLYGAWHFQRVAPLGLPANLAAMPFVSVMVMPFGLLAALLMPFGLDHWPLQVMGKGIAIMLAIADWLADRSPLDVIGALRFDALVLMTLGLVGLTVLSTALRLSALPLLAAGAVLLAFPPRPVVYLAEDAQLVGIDLGDGRLAVNRARPNAFTAEDWQRAGAFREIVKPMRRAKGAAGQPAAFSCTEQGCSGNAVGRLPVEHVGSADAAAERCGHTRLLVVADATARVSCGRGGAFVLTARDLARRGAATVNLDGDGRVAVRHALSLPYRPWHEHRTFSRAARGMAPYQGSPARKEAGETTLEPEMTEDEPVSSDGSVRSGAPGP